MFRYRKSRQAGNISCNKDKTMPMLKELGPDIRRARSANNQFFALHYKEFSGKYAGKYLVIASEGAIVRPFPSGEEATAFCEESLGEDVRDSAVIHFIDMPAGIYVA